MPRTNALMNLHENLNRMGELEQYGRNSPSAERFIGQTGSALDAYADTEDRMGPAAPDILESTLLNMPEGRLTEALQDLWDNDPTDGMGEMIERIAKARGVPTPFGRSLSKGPRSMTADPNDSVPYVDPYEFNSGGSPPARNSQMREEQRMHRQHGTTPRRY
ncbi:MAG TPA: hypothetical protein VFI48_11680 [Hyphomicrobiaceae bacterium]|nr:hypothetical protein [Hyphomicrobiaceae bacterium]